MLKKLYFPKSYWRLLLLVLLAGVLDSTFNMTLWGVDFGAEQSGSLQYEFLLSPYSPLSTGILLGLGVYCGKWFTGFTRPVTIVFACMTLAFPIYYLNNYLPGAWIGSIVLFYGSLGLATGKIWHRATLYFPRADHLKFSAFILIASVWFASDLVLSILYFLVIWPEIIQDSMVLFLVLGPVAGLVGAIRTQSDSDNDFSIGHSAYEDEDSISMMSSMLVLLLALVLWVGSMFSPVYEAPFYGMNPSLFWVAIDSTLLPLLMVLAAYQYARLENVHFRPFRLLQHLLLFSIIILLANWTIGAQFPSLSNHGMGLQSALLHCWILPILWLLLLQRWIVNPYLWLGGMIATGYLANFLSQTLPLPTGAVILTVILTFGALIVGIRDNRERLREIFQLDEAAFELEEPDDEPTNDITDHLVES